MYGSGIFDAGLDVLHSIVGTGNLIMVLQFSCPNFSRADADDCQRSVVRPGMKCRKRSLRYGVYTDIYAILLTFRCPKTKSPYGKNLTISHNEYFLCPRSVVALFVH